MTGLRDVLAQIDRRNAINCTGPGEVGCYGRKGWHSWTEHRRHVAEEQEAAVLAWLDDLLGGDEMRERVARGIAIHDDYDGCFERLDGTDPEGPLSTDAEDCEWWRARATAALAVVREMVGGGT